jgi:hypothetical protein
VLAALSACEQSAEPEAFVSTREQSLVIGAGNSVFDARDPNIDFCFQHLAADLESTRANFLVSMTQYGEILENAYRGTSVNLNNLGECGSPVSADTKIVIDEDSVAGGAVRTCTLQEKTVGECETAAGNVPILFTAGQLATPLRRAVLGAHEMIHVLGFLDEYGSGCATKTWDPSVVLTVAETSSIGASTGYCNNNTGLTARDKLSLEIVYGSNVSVDAVSGGAFATSAGRIFRLDQTVAVDWRMRGATDAAFGSEPTWRSGNAPLSTGRQFTPSQPGTYDASFTDYDGKNRSVNQFVVDTSRHTALLMLVI